MNINSIFLNKDSFLNTDTDSTPNKTGFGEILKNKIGDLKNIENNYNIDKQSYLDGKSDNIQNILIEGEKLGLDFNLALQVRNKLLDGFQEVFRMQI